MGFRVCAIGKILFMTLIETALTLACMIFGPGPPTLWRGRTTTCIVAVPVGGSLVAM
jgi:hypothetical protein